MKECELREALEKAAGDCQLSEYHKRQILIQMKGEKTVKKKLTVSLVFVIVILMLTLSVAAALMHSAIVEQLFGSSENPPEEIVEQIHTPQSTMEFALGCISLDEWFYDGRALHTAFSISNPTDEALFYTLDGIHLNGDHVNYNRIKTEGAGDSGFLLGGTVDGTVMPTTVSLYNQADEVYQFDENGKFTGMVPLTEGNAVLSISVAVWKPVRSVELVDMAEYEGLNVSVIKDHLAVDEDGYSQLWLFRPEEFHLNFNASQSGAHVYKDVYRELGWMELVDIITAETMIDLNDEQTEGMIPEAKEYKQTDYRLILEQFDFTHAGGKLSGVILGEKKVVNDLLQHVYLVDREGGRILSSGCYFGQEYDEEQGLSFSMSLFPQTADLPETVWLAPSTGYQECWDEDAPHYDPDAKKPDHVIKGEVFDFSRAVEITLKPTH